MLSSLKSLVNRRDQLVLFVGVGNVLHSDDGVGVQVSDRIRENEHIQVIKAEVSIENYIGKINSVSADAVIIIDSVFYGKKPGYCELTPVEKLLDYTTNTHNISLKKILELFHSRVWILGIQPASVSFGEKISAEVLRTADKIVRIINDHE